MGNDGLLRVDSCFNDPALYVVKSIGVGFADTGIVTQILMTPILEKERIVYDDYPDSGRLETATQNILEEFGGFTMGDYPSAGDHDAVNEEHFQKGLEQICSNYASCITKLAMKKDEHGVWHLPVMDEERTKIYHPGPQLWIDLPKKTITTDTYTEEFIMKEAKEEMLYHLLRGGFTYSLAKEEQLRCRMLGCSLQKLIGFPYNGISTNDKGTSGLVDLPS